MQEYLTRNARESEIINSGKIFFTLVLGRVYGQKWYS